ncbi:MAG: chromosomal replication initiator protein DnaA [Clostridia bacterium]|nr:chromosomal replication initiator protein DnaA [Clostridia bacterium]
MMQSFKDVWDKALLILEQDLNQTSFNSWIKMMIPMKMENDTAYFCVATVFLKKLIDQKFKGNIETALSDVMGFDVAAQIMTEEEVPPRFREIAQQKTDEVLTDINHEEEQEQIRAFNAQEHLTFENFVIGKENEFAHAAALAIANNPAGAYNPYFLYGHSGLGKTHLINAIANKIRENRPDIQILYTKGDEFTSELIDAIKYNTQRQFKQKYRSCDILLMDDVQFLSARPSVQEEMFHTFDALYENGRQIILTSDRPPREIAVLEERLQSRFSMGLIADIQPPEYETRVAIIQRKAELYNLKMPADVTELIATKIKSNVRELEGTVKKLKAFNQLWGQTPTIALAKDAMEAIIKENANNSITPEMIIENVARYHNVTVEQIKGKKKDAPVVKPRQQAMYLIRELTQLSLPEIGNAMGGKNHTTVLHSVKKVEENIQKDPAYAKTLAELTENIKKTY